MNNEERNDRSALADSTPPIFYTKSTLELVETPLNPSEINGIIVPEDVRVQLREMGLSTNAYTQGELREAIAADADGRLVDDPNGVNFADKLSLSAGEILNKGEFRDEDEDGIPDDIDIDPKPKACHMTMGFTQMIKNQRQKRIAEIASGIESTHEPLPI